MRGAVLVGGQASRFGRRPKGLEHVGGKRILDRVVDVLTEATGVPPMLVGNVTAARGWRPDLEAAADAHPGSGALVGMYTALLAAGQPVLIVGWDMPFLPAPLLTTLIRESAGFDVYLPASEGPRGLEPLCGVYRPACLPAMRRALDGADHSAVSFHEAVRVGILPLTAVSRFGAPTRLFFNVNSQSDLQQAEALWQSRE